MKAGLLLTGSGALVYLTSHPIFLDEDIIAKLDHKGIHKFIAYEIPVDEAKDRYGGHFQHVMMDLRETNDFRILDYQGPRAFSMFKFEELGTPLYHEA
ncbi:MAG: cytosolic protein [Deltaproteobacteria bacterium]|nr:cytosolic protein [Deltaproteobacteria bacterium]